VDFCSERIPGFPDTAGVNEYMKARRRARGTPRVADPPSAVRPSAPESRHLLTPSPLAHASSPPSPPAPRPRRESARSARRSRGETTTATSRCRSRRFASRPRTWRRSSSASTCTTRCRS
jgi:hypothetical protein